MESMNLKYIVDLDANPFVPSDLEVEKHIDGGQFEFDPAKVALYLDEEQQKGGVIVGDKLHKKLKSQSVYNANLLDFYLEHPDLIPKAWKNKGIFFWGTIYRNLRGDMCVRYLIWYDGKWIWCSGTLRYLGFCGDLPAAVPV